MGGQGTYPAGNYINLDLVSGVRAVNDGGTWRLITSGVVVAAIGSDYGSEGAAQDVIRQLNAGVDPSTY